MLYHWAVLGASWVALKTFSGKKTSSQPMLDPLLGISHSAKVQVDLQARIYSGYSSGKVSSLFSLKVMARSLCVISLIFFVYLLSLKPCTLVTLFSISNIKDGTVSSSCLKVRP